MPLLDVRTLMIVLLSGLVVYFWRRRPPRPPLLGPLDWTPSNN